MAASDPVPLHVNGGVIGVLDVVNRAGGFDDADVSTLSGFANQVAVAIGHARLQHEVEQPAVLAEPLNVNYRLPIAIESELYWIAQEALNSVRKHAAARHMIVQLRFTATTVSLEVSDDGVGFESKAMSPEKRGGLLIVAERTARIGGNLVHESTPGEGTLVRVEVTL